MAQAAPARAHGVDDPRQELAAGGGLNRHAASAVRAKRRQAYPIDGGERAEDRGQRPIEVFDLQVHDVELANRFLQVGWRVQRDDPPEIDDPDAIGQLVRFLHVVGGQKDAPALALDV